MEMIEGKASRTFITLSSLLKKERTSSNFKLTLHEAPMRALIAYAPTPPKRNLRQIPTL
jgi:hypothetical protein